MASKKNKDDIEELKKSLDFRFDFLTEEMSVIRKQQVTIMDLVAEVKMLQTQSVEKDKRIDALETRIQGLEQYSRINDVIVSGLRIKPRSYARALGANNERGRGDTEDESTEQQVAAFLQTKGITLDCDNIEACHTLPTKDNNNKPAVIMRFVNRKHKTALLKQGKKLKGTDVYLNEHLTKHNADIAKQARYLRKQKKIQSTWTASCKIFIKLNGTPEEAKVLLIKSIEELDKYQ